MRMSAMIGILLFVALLTLGISTFTGLSIYDVGSVLNVDTAPEITIPDLISLDDGGYRIIVSGGNGKLVFHENSDVFSIDGGLLSANTTRGEYELIVIVMDEDGDYDMVKVRVEI